MGAKSCRLLVLTRLDWGSARRGLVTGLTSVGGYLAGALCSLGWFHL